MGRDRKRKTGRDGMTHRGNMLIRRKSAEIIEWLFLFVTGFYLICQCIYNSTYVLPTYSFPDRPVFLVILYAAATLALGRMILTGLQTVRVVLTALTAVIFFFAYRTGRELFLLMIPVLRKRSPPARTILGITPVKAQRVVTARKLPTAAT